MSLAPDAQTVLVVDDQSGIRSLLRRILELEGLAVVDAKDGATALERFAQTPAIAAAMIDITMPGMDGVTLASKLRELAPQLPLILMSGFDMDDLFESEATFDPPAGYLEKPFDLQRVARIVNEALS